MSDVPAMSIQAVEPRQERRLPLLLGLALSVVTVSLIIGVPYLVGVLVDSGNRTVLPVALVTATLVPGLLMLIARATGEAWAVTVTAILTAVVIGLLLMGAPFGAGFGLVAGFLIAVSTKVATTIGRGGAGSMVFGATAGGAVIGASLVFGNGLLLTT